MGLDFTGPLEGGRAVSCRVVSAVCFFVLILNNAPALRAGKQKMKRKPKNNKITSILETFSRCARPFLKKS